MFKCLTNRCSEFKRVFNSILDEVGTELGFDLKQTDDGLNLKQEYYNSINLKHISKLLHIFAEYNQSEINFLVKMNHLLDSSLLHNNLNKLVIQKISNTMQSICNCSFEIQSLNDLLNGTVVFLANVDNYNKEASVMEEETGTTLKIGIYSNSDLNLKMDSNEFTEIAIKKKICNSDMKCNIL